MHVAVLGAGYAGISLVRKLERSLPSDVEITLIDERETHLVQHLVHRIVRKPELADQLTIPIEDVIDRAEHVQARVTDVDPDAGTVTLEDGELSYDLGAVCLGARTAYYGLPGVEEHSTPLKRAGDALHIREEFEGVRETGGRIVVGGAGLSGIQVAGELAELAREHDSPESDESGGDREQETGMAAEVVLLEQESTVAPPFPDQFQRAVAEELAAKGVDIRTERTVSAVDGETIEFADGSELAYDQLVWTGGITGQEAVGDRAETNATLRAGERTFAVGDAARVVDADGEPAPASAQTAVRQADVAAKNIRRLCEYHRSPEGFEPRLERYRYTSLGWLVSIGDQTVAQVGPSVIRGTAAETLKTGVGVGYLTNIGAIEDAARFAEGALVKH